MADLKLSSGREVYAHGGILGISPNLELHHGYDGSISYPLPDWEDDPELAANYLSHAELVELADIAIERWTRLREAALSAIKGT